MSAPILATKLYVPPPRPEAVPRSRLIERLDDGLHRKLTLVSAPAGFGKTTLLGEWATTLPRPAAWLSLDEGDNDPTRFLSYLVAALLTIAPNIGEGVLGALRSPQPPTESILTALLNEMAAVVEDSVLILDDYHVVDAEAVDDALTFLVEHLPPRMHLVIATREDPPLPIARLRARGQMSELRAAELRFTLTEAAEFLGGAMSLKLSAEEMAALEDRTEGWIAGLQLAALSMRGREDVPGFIRAFAGDNRYVLDYLAEEVLRRQPERIRSFLLRTSVLERLSGPLCDAVTSKEDGGRMLEALERGNFFVVPLDDKRRWYRYHHLFADVLYAHLIAEQPDLVPVLHRRASEWYEQNGPLADAIPDALLRFRPVLSVHYAGTLLQSGQLEGVEDRLRDAERWLETSADIGERAEASSAEMVVVDEEEFRRLPGSVATYRAGIALVLGDVAHAMKHAQRALELALEDDRLLRASAAALLGLAYWTSGDLEAGYRSYAESMQRLQRAGHLSDALGCAIALADIRFAQGRLRDAMGTYERGLRLATEQGEAAMRGAAD